MGKQAFTVSFNGFIFLLLLTLSLSSCKRHRVEIGLTNIEARNFGDVELMHSKVQVFFLENTGRNLLSFDVVQILDTNSSFQIDKAQSTCLEGSKLAPRAICQIAVSFTPSEVKEYQSEVRLVFSNPEKGNKSEFNPILEGRGILQQDLETVQSGTTNFGRSELFETVTQSITIRNKSDARISLEQFRLEKNDGAFAIDQGSECLALSELRSDTSCEIKVSFSPDELKNYTDQVRVTYSRSAIENAPSKRFTINLSGRGDQSEDLELRNQSARQFGASDIYVTASRSLRIQNKAAYEVQIHQIDIEDNNNVFEMNFEDSSCGENLINPSQECTLRIDFHPTRRISYVGKVTLYYSRPDRPVNQWKTLTFNLSGSGQLNCSVNESLASAFQEGISRAQEEMAQETQRAQSRAQALGYQDGYEINYPQGYAQTYQENFDQAFEQARIRARDRAYLKYIDDELACLQGERDGRLDGREDADEDAFINAVNDAQEDVNVRDYFNIGKTDGYNDGRDYCEYNYFVDPTDDLYYMTHFKQVSQSHLNSCEAQGFSQSYDSSHYQREYNRFLAANDDYQRGLSEGMQEGRADGESEGTDNGQQEGDEEGYEQGRLMALDEQYQKCYSEEYLAEYNYNYHLLYNNYYSQAYNNMRDEQYDFGYQEGFVDGFYETCGFEPGYEDLPFYPMMANSSAHKNLLSVTNQILSERSENYVSHGVNVSKTYLSRRRDFVLGQTELIFNHLNSFQLEDAIFFQDFTNQQLRHELRIQNMGIFLD